MDYLKINNNPKSLKTEDCTTRAIAQATGERWETILGEQYEKALNSGYAPESIEVTKMILANHGFIEHKKPFHANGKTYMVKDMDKILNGDTAVLQLANHLTCIKDNAICDIWNCSYKSVYRYWTKPSDGSTPKGKILASRTTAEMMVRIG